MSLLQRDVASACSEKKGLGTLISEGTTEARTKRAESKQREIFQVSSSSRTFRINPRETITVLSYDAACPALICRTHFVCVSVY